MFAALIALFLTQTVPPASGSSMWWYNDTCTRAGGRCQYLRNGRPNSLAFFEFAPSSGAGMGTACTCTAVTGAKGEALTFTRTGNATCSKQGLATTGINNGDLVVCAGDQPRVESLGGVLGLRVEGARTNSTLRSQELDNAAWLNNVSSAPFNTAVTANAATAPDGTVTADRLDVIATTGTDLSTRAQVAGCPGIAQGISVYVRGVSGSGTIDICNNSTCTACPYVDTSWSRCVGTAAVAVAGGQFAIGNGTVWTGVSRPTQSVFLWGMSCEAGTYATSYIPTVASAVTRNRDVATFTLPQTAYSIAATAQVPYPNAASITTGPVVLRHDDGTVANHLSTYWLNTAALETQCVQTGALCNSNIQSAVQTVPSTTRVAFWRVPNTSFANIVNSVQVSTVDGRGAFALSALRLGAWITAGAELDGIITRVCADPDPTRCR